MRYSLLIILFTGQFIYTSSVIAQTDKGVNHSMRHFPENQKILITTPESETYCPFNEDGWYYSQVGVEATPDGLVAVYRKSDFHTATSTDIMIAYSSDGGKSWQGHHSISHSDVWNQGGCWVAPQFSKLKNGRLIIIADWGKRSPGQDHPMLAQWQLPGRGMANYLFWSDDHGKTWIGPIKIDDVGGEPGYITELSNGDLIYTRTKSKNSDILWNPPQPWGNRYYYNEAVISSDSGKSWNYLTPIADDPHHGDCEVGIAEYKPGKLLAITRIGMGGGAYGQPSRFVYSDDYGRTWKNHQLGPIYAQRAIVHPLQSGKLLVTYRNRWGTPGTYALIFDADEKLPYEPASFIYREENCTLTPDGAMNIRSNNGSENLVIYTFYPAQSPDSRVEIEVDLKVTRADIHGCVISAGCYITFLPDKVYLSDQPEHFFEIDATQWHHYQIIRENGRIKIYVDQELKLDASTEGLETRMVQIGNRAVQGFNIYTIGSKGSEDWGTVSDTHWKSISVKVTNSKDYSIDWTWDPSRGFPDQFRRDRVVVLDRIAAHFGHSGYSGWTQAEDGAIVIADYTVGGNGGEPAPMPFVRAYLASEEDLSGNVKN